MNKLKILIYPNDEKILRKKSFKVNLFDGLFKQFVNDMLYTLKEEPNGIGLSAVQVGVLKNVFVVDLKNDTSPLVFVNPKITWKSEETLEYEEGCLSLPNYAKKMCRSKEIEIKYKDQNGNVQIKKLDGLLAIVCQHEYDHLEGKLLND